jgi:hypothetical protein
MFVTLERFFFFMVWVVLALIAWYFLAGFVRDKMSGNALGRFAGWTIAHTEGA